MEIRLVALLGLIAATGCQSSQQIAASEIDRDLGNFAEIPSGWQAQNVHQHGDEFHYGYGDVPDKINRCRDKRYEICLYVRNQLAFVVPVGALQAGQTWSEFGYSFSVAKIVIDTAYIDVRLPDPVNDWMRFFYKDGAVFGFSYGTPVTRERCENCFDARITYVWTGDGGFRLPDTK